jgi:hypothetical protein
MLEAARSSAVNPSIKEEPVRILTAMFILLVAFVGVAHAAYPAGDSCVGKATLAADQDIARAAQVAATATGPVPEAVVACPERSFGWQDRVDGRNGGPEAGGDSGPGSGSTD